MQYGCRPMSCGDTKAGSCGGGCGCASKGGAGEALNLTGGTGVDAANIKQGDTVFVELTVQNQSSETIKNVAIVDRVPAGFEIENPRLGKSEDLQWMKDVFKAEYQDLRDDRLQVFGDLPAKSTQYIYYSARAVTKGRFTAPASLVEAMYDPANFDYDKDTAVQIVEAKKK